MALIDVLKYQGKENEIVWKFPSEDLRIGSQLVVSTSQNAIFVRGGKIYDSFDSGTYTLSTKNIPLLNKVVNFPFGGKSPFQAEVWFINKISKLDNKWGTSQPVEIEDRKYDILVRYRAFGQFGFTISNPRLFLESLVGTENIFTVDKLIRSFKANIISSFKAVIKEQLNSGENSILDLISSLDQLSTICKPRIEGGLNMFGIQLVTFFIESINIPEDDPSLLKLRNAKDAAMQVKIKGKELYGFDRHYDVMDKAAENQGSTGEAMGLGVGFAMGNNMANKFSNFGNETTRTNDAPPDLPKKTSYWVAINSNKTGPFSIEKIADMINENKIDKSTLLWKKGMSNWECASSISDINDIFESIPPPIS